MKPEDFAGCGDVEESYRLTTVEIKYCSLCDKEYSRDRTFCTGCGRVLATSHRYSTVSMAKRWNLTLDDPKNKTQEKEKPMSEKKIREELDKLIKENDVKSKDELKSFLTAELDKVSGDIVSRERDSEYNRKQYVAYKRAFRRSMKAWKSYEKKSDIIEEMLEEL